MIFIMKCNTVYLNICSDPINTWLYLRGSSHKEWILSFHKSYG